LALFGKDHSELLHQILREIGELRERVTSQQQAIDQIRSDTTAALNTGLTENRAVVRDGLHRHQDTIGEPLARISTELVSIRAAVNDLGRGTLAAAPTPEPDKQPADDAISPPDAGTDDELLRAAAGISRAQLRVHRDTWAFLVEHAIRDRHFRIPGNVVDDGGAVSVHVSGPSLVAAITRLDQVSSTSDSSVTRAIAGHLHDRLGETVRAIISNPHRGDGADEVAIVIDDRAKPAEEDN
jgi:hypothetical protein